MKTAMRFVVIFLFLFPATWDAYGQTSLEQSAQSLDISIRIPPYYKVSQNTDRIYIMGEEEEREPTLAQLYDLAPAYGNVAFKVFLGLANAVVEHESGAYMICIDIPPGKSNDPFDITQDKAELYTYNNLSFGRIKSDFRYGNPMNWVSKWEAHELYSMLTHYPKRKARKMFNANVLVSYPLNLKGNIYKQYSRCRAAVAARGGHEIYFYFLMTDESSKHFDDYLKDVSGMFWFNR